MFSPAGVIHWCGVPSLIHGVMPPCRCRVARFSVKQSVGLGVSPHIGLRTPSSDGALVRRHVHRHAVRVEHHHVRARAGAHERGVDRQEQVAADAGRQQVAEQDPDRPVLGGDDRRARGSGGCRRRCSPTIGVSGSGGIEVRVAQGDLVAGHDAGRELDVAAQQRGRQVAVELHPVLDDRDLVVVGAGVGGRVGDGDRDVLAEVVRAGRPEAGQGVDELLEARREVAGAGVGDGDRGDGALDGDRCGGAGALVGAADVSVIVTVGAES